MPTLLTHNFTLKVYIFLDSLHSTHTTFREQYAAHKRLFCLMSVC